MTRSIEDFDFDVICLAGQLSIVTNLTHEIILHLDLSDMDGASLEFHAENTLQNIIFAVYNLPQEL